jgi:hypothetical protein
VDARLGGVAVLLDELMPRYEFDGVHRVRVSTPPDRALEALRRETPGEMPLVRLLFAARSLPTRLAGKRGLPADSAVALYEQLARMLVPLAEDPGREVVVGGIGQMWKLAGGDSPAFRDASGFVAFEEPGYAKVATNFSALPLGDSTELRTETRVLTTDPGLAAGFWALLADHTSPERSDPAQLAARGEAQGRVRRRSVRGAKSNGSASAGVTRAMRAINRVRLLEQLREAHRCTSSVKRVDRHQVFRGTRALEEIVHR